jgi:chromosome segregation ATPase
MNNAYNLLLDRLARLIDLINKLIELANEMEGYTSDNEEETFVNDLESELKELKQHHSETEDELKLIEKEIIYLQNNLNQHPPEVDEEKANKVDNAIGDLSQMIENIEKLVDTKIQRLADMDPYKKFRRREKE